MNGSPSVRVALFIRESGSESPCRWFYVTGIYSISPPVKKIDGKVAEKLLQEVHELP